MVRKLAKKYKEWGLSINMKKAEFLIAGKCEEGFGPSTENYIRCRLLQILGTNFPEVALVEIKLKTLY